MAFAIETFGPFSLDETTGAIDQVGFRASVDNAREGLINAFGVYVIASELPAGGFIPWYVGLTLTSFQARFRSHFRKLKVVNEIRNRENAPSRLCVFLVAVTTPQKTRVAAATVSRKRWVGTIETMLIGACIAANPELVNNKKTLLGKKLSIPGFTGEKQWPGNSSATSFAQMLRYSKPK